MGLKVKNDPNKMLWTCRSCYDLALQIDKLQHHYVSLWNTELFLKDETVVLVDNDTGCLRKIVPPMFSVLLITFKLFDVQHPGFTKMRQKLAWNRAEVRTLYVKWFKSYERKTEHGWDNFTWTPCSLSILSYWIQ